MRTIAQFSQIKEQDLNTEYYLQSLIEAGLKKNMLCQADIESIRLQFMGLLAYKSQRYTSGDSSSIKTETAKNILESCLFTTGLFLKTLGPDEGICVLKQGEVKKLYDAGRRKLDIKLKTAKHLYANVLKNMIQTENITYSATLKGGIEGFFKLYDADYAAHEIRITADYPLSNPIRDLAGIEFMIEYLKSIAIENEFCKKFDDKNIHLVMLAYHSEYEHLVINLFDQVLLSAIGCILTNTLPSMLLIPGSKAIQLQSQWLLKTKYEIENEVFAAGRKLIERLSIHEEAHRRYIRESLIHLSGTIYAALQTLTLNKVFVGLC